MSLFHRNFKLKIMKRQFIFSAVIMQLHTYTVQIKACLLITFNKNTDQHQPARFWKESYPKQWILSDFTLFHTKIFQSGMNKL